MKDRAAGPWILLVTMAIGCGLSDSAEIVTEPVASDAVQQGGWCNSGCMVNACRGILSINAAPGSKIKVELPGHPATAERAVGETGSANIELPVQGFYTAASRTSSYPAQEVTVAVKSPEGATTSGRFVLSASDCLKGPVGDTNRLVDAYISCACAPKNYKPTDDPKYNSTGTGLGGEGVSNKDESCDCRSMGTCVRRQG